MKIQNTKYDSAELKDLLELSDSGTWGDKSENGSYVLRSSDVHNNKIIYDDPAKIDIPSIDKDRKRLVDGDIIITKSSGSSDLIGKCGIYYAPTNDSDYFFSNFMLRIRPLTNKLSYKWLFYWLTSEYGKHVLKSINNTTSGLRNLNTNLYLKQEIPLPPLEEQKRIAAILDKADVLCQKRKESIRLLDEFLRSVFLDMFGDYNIGADHVDLSDVCVINPSKTEIKASEQNLEASFLPMALVGEDGSLDLSKTGIVSELKKRFTYFREGDVLFAKITPSMENGKGAIAKNLKNGIGFGTTEFHVLRPKESISSAWIFMILASKNLRKKAESYMIGTAGQQRVPASFLSNIKVNQPSPEKIKFFDQIFDKINNTKNKMIKTNEKYDNLFDSLVQRAFRGEL